MPEGDTIFRSAAVLRRALAGARVLRFETALAQVAREDRERRIAGRTVESVDAAGKHLLIRFSGGAVLRTHMRMNGSWHLYRPGERWRRPRASMRIAIETARWVAVAFDVSVAEWIPAAALARHPALARLGPDLLAPGLDAEEAARRLRARPDAEIGDALLDQRAVAGVGNVFKSEILFLAGLDPHRPVRSLGDDDLRRVVSIARRLLRANVEPPPGAPRTWTGGRRTTGRSDPSHALWVYGRAGQPCRRCGSRIAFTRRGQAARGTYSCPACQPAAAPRATE
jgi:endonuclease VIII